MRRNLNVRGLGLSVGAVLGAVYSLMVLASISLIGFLTTGSWRALVLGLEWQTLIGFELGLLALTAVALGAALLAGIVERLIWKLTSRQARIRPAPHESTRIFPSWAIRALAVYFLLPAVLFPVLHTVVSMFPVSAASERGRSQTDPVNLSTRINTPFREAEPSFTADGRTMYFNCYNGDICVSHLTSSWEQADWTAPERLGAPVNTEYEEIEPVINAAGDVLYFTSIRPIGLLKGMPLFSPFVDVIEVVNRLITGNGGQPLLGGLGLDDIWVSRRIDGVWSEPQSINAIPGEPPVNTLYADHCLFFSADGSEAFWTSTRPGGYGSDDIWTSRRIGGIWTAPQDMGKNVNGLGSEHTSIPTPDGNSLYVTSDRPGGFGGEDIYLTTRGADGTWGPMINVGAPVNGPDDDRCPAWTPDLKIFLFDSIRAGGNGARDMWWIDFKTVKGSPAPDAPVSIHPGP